MNKKTLIALGVSIALNCALLGFVIAKGVYEPKFPPPPPTRDMIVPDGMPIAPPKMRSQRPDFGPERGMMVKAFKDAIKDNKGQMEAAKKEVADALRSDPFDADRLKAAMENANELRKSIDTAVQTAVMEQILNMDAEQRKAFANKFDCQCRGEEECPCDKKRIMKKRPRKQPSQERMARGRERHERRMHTEGRPMPMPQGEFAPAASGDFEEVIIERNGVPVRVIRKGDVVFEVPYDETNPVVVYEQAEGSVVVSSFPVSISEGQRLPPCMQKQQTQLMQEFETAPMPCHCKNGASCPCMEKTGKCNCSDAKDCPCMKKKGRKAAPCGCKKGEACQCTEKDGECQCKGKKAPKTPPVDQASGRRRGKIAPRD